jgi:hypothetical protein
MVPATTAGGGGVLFLGQADGLELVSDTAETVWGVISVLLLITVALLLAWLVRTAWRHRRTVQSLEQRVARLEAERVDSDLT